jgi:uncharacterized protein (TIRG00374 family)
MEKKTKKTIKKTIQLLIGLAIIFWGLQVVGVSNILDALRSTTWWILIFMLAAQAVYFAVGALNTYLLFRPFSKRGTTYTKILEYYCLSWAIAIFAPGKVGEFSLVYFLKKEDATIGEGLSLTIVDKLISLMVILIFSTIVIFTFFNQGNLLLAVAAVAAAAFLVVLLMLSGKVRGFIRKYVLRKHAKLFKGFNKANLKYLGRYKMLLFYNIGLSLIRSALIALIAYIIFLALGVTTLPYWPIILISSLSQLIKMVPVTLNGLGTMEAFRYYMYFTFFGIEGGIIAAMLTINLLLRYFTAFVIYLYYVLFRGSGRKNRRRVHA